MFGYKYLESVRKRRITLRKRRITNKNINLDVKSYAN
jgi:hypothetical protein